MQSAAATSGRFCSVSVLVPALVATFVAVAVSRSGNVGSIATSPGPGPSPASTLLPGGSQVATAGATGDQPSRERSNTPTVTGKEAGETAVVLRGVGLVNEGATCFLNAVLQRTFHLGALQRLIRSRSIADPALAGLFNTMAHQSTDLLPISPGQRYAVKSVSAKVVRRALGLHPGDQHDASEALRMLFVPLSEDLYYQELVGGSMTTQLVVTPQAAAQIGAQLASSPRTELFTDLAVPVEGFDDVQTALLDGVLAPELMTGAERWLTPSHGRQDAHRLVEVTRYPPILTLTLNRFGLVKDHIRKNNKLMMFPVDEPLLLGDEVYVLHSVVVHAGSAEGGHYITFIDPQADGRWLKCDDAQVIGSSSEEVRQYGFGGGKLGPSAYILSYVRQQDARRVLKPYSRT